MPDLNWAIVLTVLLGISGCGIQKAFIKAYEGQDLPAEQIALVKPQLGIVIKSMDGDPSKQLTVFGKFGSTDADIALAPGSHTFVLAYDSIRHVSSVRSVADITFTFRVRAGRKYLLKAVLPSDYSTWRPEIEDVTDKPELWCITAPRC